MTPRSAGSPRPQEPDRQSRGAAAAAAQAPLRWGRILSALALLIALAAVLGRCTLLEAMRDRLDVTPGTPRGPGPGATVAMDLLCFLPALLVLLRRVVDRGFSLRWQWTHVLLAMLCGWMALSIVWADDQYAAALSTTTFWSAASLLWAMTQLVRGWGNARLVCGFAFGLLLLLVIQGFYYRYLDYPDLRQAYLANRKQILEQRGMEPGGFLAQQFEKKILSGESVGFNESPNSFAGELILLMTLGCGAAIQRRRDRDGAAVVVAILLPMPLVFWLLLFTYSKAAMVTPLLAAAFLLFIWKKLPSLALHPRRWYWTGVAALAAVFAAVIGHGLAHGRLPTDSLNFRWRYWVGSWRMFRRRPLLGFGWSNFGEHYLRDRLPAASEEILDPHNFLVRFFVELGIVGGVIAAAWFARLWWDATQPAISATASGVSRRAGIPWIVLIALGAMIVSTIFGIDLAVNPNYVIIEIFKRVLWGLALVTGALLVCLRSMAVPKVDDRPAPWMLYALLVALGIFLIHNLIEFSLFEAGPLCLFMLLMGTALALRAGERPRRSTALPAAVLATAGAVWILVLVMFCIPAARAEADMRNGEDALHAGHFDQSESAYVDAAAAMPLDADAEYRAGLALHQKMEALLRGGALHQIPIDMLQAIRGHYRAAIARDPSAIHAYLGLASLEMQVSDKQGMVENYRKALALNPNDVQIRLDFARALRLQNMPEQARQQLKLALRYNDELDPAEPKRLAKTQVEAIQRQIAATQP